MTDAQDAADPAAAPPGRGDDSAAAATSRLLLAALRAVHARTRGGGHAHVRDLLDPLGARASALGSALLALPFLWPLSLGPLTSPAAALIAWFGYRVIRDHGSDRLPERLLALPLPERVHRLMVLFARRALRMRRRLRPGRMPGLVDGKRGRVFCGAAMVTGAALLAMPVPLLPFTNTLPALGIVLATVGWSERDGALVVAGWVAQVLGLLLMLVLLGIIALGGWQAVAALW